MAALVAVRFMIGGTQNFDLHDRISNGTIVAVVSFVEYPVVIITLMLASRRSGPGVVAYLWGGYSALAAHCDYSGWSCRLGRFGRCTSADARWPGLGLVARTRAFGPRGRFALLVVACGSGCRTNRGGTPVSRFYVPRFRLYSARRHSQYCANLPNLVAVTCPICLVRDSRNICVRSAARTGALDHRLDHTHDPPSYAVQSGSFDRDGIRAPLGSDGEFIFFGQ